MIDKPVQLLIAAFDEEDAADSAAKRLKSARKDGQVDFDNMAVVRRDDNGRLHVKETGDMSTLRPGSQLPVLTKRYLIIQEES